jgi:tRNA(Arg) A34 adenosine deaminase TadA
LNVAVKLAETSEENMKHGCVIVLGGSIQAMGVNKRTNDPYFHKDLHWLSEHAEMAALRRCRRTNGAVLYVARVNKHGEERMSKPCAKCTKLLKKAGVKKVVYTIDSSLYL